MSIIRLSIVALATLSMASSVAFAADSAWTEKVSATGDMRVRLTRVVNGQNAASTGTTDNYQPKLRARLGVSGKVNDGLSANVRLGTNNGTTRSTSSNLYPASQPKTFSLLLGYLDYKPTDSISIHLGKSPNPYYSAGKTAIGIGSDVTWEGVQMIWKGDTGNMKPFATAGYANVIDRVDNAKNDPATPSDTSTKGADIGMFGAQFGTKMSMDPLDFTVALSTYNFNNIKGYATSASNPLCNSSATDCYGNTVQSDPGPPANTSFKFDYKIVHAALEIGYHLGFAPVAAFVDYIQNQDPASENAGTIGGLKLGALKEQGSWLIGLNYRDVRKDATIGYFTDESYLLGTTDVIGTQLVLGYQAWPNASINFNWDSGRVGISSPSNYNVEKYNFDFIANF